MLQHAFRADAEYAVDFSKKALRVTNILPRSWDRSRIQERNRLFMDSAHCLTLQHFSISQLMSPSTPDDSKRFRIVQHSHAGPVDKVEFARGIPPYSVPLPSKGAFQPCAKHFSPVRPFHARRAVALLCSIHSKGLGRSIVLLIIRNLTHLPIS